MAFQEWLPPILASVVADPVAIIVGLSIFVITIIAFPAILKISDTVTQIVLSTIFGFREAETLLPSDEEVPDQDRGNETNPYYRPLKKMFSYLLHPSKSWKKIKEDWTFIEDSPAKNIRKKLKSLFFILATIAACVVYFFPPVTSLGIIHVTTAALLQAGLHQALAHYVITIITGGLVYACRAPLVGAGLGIRALYRCCYESCRQKASESTIRGSTAQLNGSIPLRRRRENSSGSEELGATASSEKKTLLSTTTHLSQTTSPSTTPSAGRT
ncbi:MAG: hypothetical protein K0R24_1433 [Gammaproteobacteria bacterium]|jgi:hypothetical protein|nr:hypothetical protein [Gammaproteobacteria bacterium]